MHATPAQTPLSRTLTELDHARLLRLCGQPAGADAVAELLDAAELVPSAAVAADVVTMRSQLLLRELPEGAERRLTLCYPAEADAAAGQVSVLSPVGRALLGLRQGQRAQWHTPDGRPRCGEIVTLLYQPEASGDLLR